MSPSRRACLSAGPIMFAAALSACSSPPTHYYRLAVIAGTSRSSAPFTVGIRSVSIPGYLDQSGIAKGGGDYRFDVYSNDLWADQLASMLQAVMVQDLAQRLPTATVIGTGGSIGVSPDVLVEINVLRFDPDSAGQLVLNAQIAIKSGRTRALWATQSFAQHAPPDGVDASGIVAGMSLLWAAMAEQIADFLAEYSSSQGAGLTGSD